MDTNNIDRIKKIKIQRILIGSLLSNYNKTLQLLRDNNLSIDRVFFKTGDPNLQEIVNAVLNLNNDNILITKETILKELIKDWKFKEDVPDQKKDVINHYEKRFNDLIKEFKDANYENLINSLEFYEGINHYSKKDRFNYRRTSYSGIDIDLFINQDSKSKKIKIPTGAITTIGAETGKGKTSLLLNILYRLALSKDINKHLYFFTYEEHRNPLIDKLHSIFLDIHKEIDKGYGFIVNRFENAENIQELESDTELHLNEFDSFMQENIRFNDRNYSINQLDNFIRELHLNKKIGGVFIDYIQEVQPNEKTNNSYEKIQLVCRKLKSIASDTNLPIIMATQFNREKIGMKTARSREGSDIEMASNLYMGIEKPDNDNETLKLSIIKGRDTGEGNVYVKFNGVTRAIKFPKHSNINEYYIDEKNANQSKEPTDDFDDY